jgi:hypothetical protein
MNRMTRMRAGSLVSAMKRAGRAQSVVAGSVAEKLATEFAKLAGSRDNARDLVERLRGGSIAPTGPMGWMDVKITLVLVQDSLARSGNPSPSGDELERALRDLLWMRAGGIGWGRIAFIVGRGGPSLALARMGDESSSCPRPRGPSRRGR